MHHSDQLVGLWIVFNKCIIEYMYYFICRMIQALWSYRELPFIGSRMETTCNVYLPCLIMSNSSKLSKKYVEWHDFSHKLYCCWVLIFWPHELFSQITMQKVLSKGIPLQTLHLFGHHDTTSAIYVKERLGPIPDFQDELNKYIPFLVHTFFSGEPQYMMQFVNWFIRLESQWRSSKESSTLIAWHNKSCHFPLQKNQKEQATMFVFLALESAALSMINTHCLEISLLSINQSPSKW